MKYSNYLVVLLFAITLTSCTFTENIYLNEDGTGKFSIDMDGSGLMAMVPEDSIKTQKAVDTTFSFKDLFADKRDSIAKLPKAEQDRLKKLESFSVRTKMNPTDKQFLFTMFTDFKSVGDLQDAMSTMDQVKGSSKGSDNPLLAAGGIGSNNSDLKYTYDGKKFTRKATVLKKEILEVENDSAEAYKMIFESSTYVIKYHFPKRVKKVSNSTALYSEDRKSITIEYPFSEYMENPDKLNFEVEFEK